MGGHSNKYPSCTKPWTLYVISIKMRILLIILITLNVAPLKAQRPYFYSLQEKDNNQKESYVLYSKFGKRITSSKFDWISTNYWGWVFGWKNKLIKVYDSTGKYLNIDSIQEIHNIWSNTNIIPLKRNGYWGYYSKDGKLKIRHQYDDATLFKNGKAAVKLKDHFYFIDTSGNVLSEKYIESRDYGFESLSTPVGLTNFSNWPQEIFKKDGKVGLIEKATGKILIDALYDGIFSITKDNVIVEKSKKFGVVNFLGEVIIPIEYDMIYLLD